MTKVHGKRYAYKFDFHGLMAACQAQAQAGSSTTGDGVLSYKYHTHHSELGAALYPAPTTKLPLLPAPVTPTVSPYWSTAAAAAASSASLQSIYSVAPMRYPYNPGNNWCEHDKRNKHKDITFHYIWHTCGIKFSVLL